MIERLEGAFQSMDRFTADASHELRNPLATLRNTLDVMLAQPRTVPEQRAAMESISEDVERLRRIVEDLLLLARADKGRLVMERSTVRVDLLAQALVETYQPLAFDRGLVLEAEGSSPVQTIGDERWLFQLGANLLDNALKFTPRGGRVTVQAYGEAGAAWMMVRDTGPGIPEESLERIFERFYQVDASRTRAALSGSGLGLAIAAWIATAHGGRIFARNQPGGGALFTLELKSFA